MRAITAVFLAISLIAALISPCAVIAADSPCDGVTEIPTSECLALESIYNFTNGPGWDNHTNWLTSLTPSNWYGVWVSGGHVSELLLNENNLVWTLPDVFSNLPYLIRVELGFNSLTGSIPSSISSLSSLLVFQVVDNDLTGTIPTFFGGLSNLQRLVLSGNQFSGTIPPELGNLTNLIELRLDRNNLTGYLPDELGNLAQLTTFYVDTNNLIGSIPLTYTNLTALTEFFFNSTDLCEPDDPEFAAWKATFTIPPRNWYGTDRVCQDYYCSTRVEIPVEECQALVLLYIDTNGNEWINNANWLSMNPIDSWYGIASSDGHVYEIYLPYNNLTGSIPTFIDVFTGLKYLYLYNNNLTGGIPVELGNLPSLLELYLDSNQLTGGVPVELSQLYGLTKLGISDNLLSGNIPFELGLLVNLRYLNVSNNQLSGSIPITFIHLPYLDFFAFDETNLCELSTPEFLTWKSTVNSWVGTGILCQDLYCLTVTEIPPAECNALVSLYFSTNGDEWINNTNWLETDNPSGWVGVTVSSGHVTNLIANSNNLYGMIPSDLSNLTNLVNLRMNFNRLTGPIPSSIGNLVNLQYIQFVDNNLSGPIPPEMGTLANLQVLLLSDNQFSDTIPPELGNLTSIYDLRLDRNQLTGTIPNELTNLANLSTFYVSQNDLTGSLPSGFGTLQWLYDFRVNDNLLAGSIPMDYTELTNLEHFYFFSTNLCEPDNPLYISWKAAVTDYNGTGLVCKYCFLPVISR